MGLRSRSIWFKTPLFKLFSNSDRHMTTFMQAFSGDVVLTRPAPASVADAKELLADGLHAHHPADIHVLNEKQELLVDDEGELTGPISFVVAQPPSTPDSSSRKLTVDMLDAMSKKHRKHGVGDIMLDEKPVFALMCGETVEVGVEISTTKEARLAVHNALGLSMQQDVQLTDEGGNVLEDIDPICTATIEVAIVPASLIGSVPVL